MDKAKKIIPWYIKNTLSDIEKKTVEIWIQRDPNARIHHKSIQQLSKALHTQTSQVPSPEINALLLIQVKKQPIQSKNNIYPWLWSGPTMLLIFILLWLIVQPVTQLQWSTNGNAPELFRIYRSQTGDGQYQLIEELPAIPSKQIYQYSDLIVVPGRNYQYIIEVRDQSGNTSLSQTVMSNSLMTFAAQISILITSIVLTFGLVALTLEVKSFPQLQLTV